MTLDLTRVSAPCGSVRGAVQDGVHVFRGIPYAAAPIGPLRFAPTRPAPAVADIDATWFGPISLQELDPLPAVKPGTEYNYYAADTVTDEDCLSLNVWTADPSGNAPVYVFIHGGAWLCGSGTGDWASGGNHAREHGIVVVTLNYRLGLLGGLWLGDYDPRASNLAIQDMTQALSWVHDNIAAFGGDPERVTVGGQSAGAMSTVALLCAPGARGLFRRAVVESGHADVFISVENARRATRTILERLFIDPDGDEVLERLRSTSTLRLLALQRELGIRLSTRTFPLVTDDVILVGDPLRALGSGCAKEIDLLIGSNREEDRLFTAIGGEWRERSISAAAESLLPGGVARDGAVESYTTMADAERLDAYAIDHIITTDHAWAEPVRAAALAHSGSGGRTYHFEFAWGSSVPGIGAAHLVELPFFFGNLDARGVPDLLGHDVHHDPSTVALGEAVSAAVAEFVRSGDLSESALGAWPAYTPAERSTMVIDRESRVESDYLGRRLDFWQSRRDISAQPLSNLGELE